MIYKCYLYDFSHVLSPFVEWFVLPSSDHLKIATMPLGGHYQLLASCATKLDPRNRSHLGTGGSWPACFPFLACSTWSAETELIYSKLPARLELSFTFPFTLYYIHAWFLMIFKWFLIVFKELSLVAHDAGSNGTMPLQLSENLQEALSEEGWGQPPHLAALFVC